MSSALLQEASSTATATSALTTILELPNGTPGSPQKQQQSCNEKDISYWQRSMEVLAQKVIVGDTVVVKKDKKNSDPSSVLAEEEEDQVDLELQQQQQISGNQQDSGVGLDASIPADVVAAEQMEGNGNEDDGKDGDASDTSEAIEKQQQKQHDSNLFRLSCCCGACFNYRETIIQLFVEDFEYNTLWERLQLLIKKFYDFIPEQNESLLYSRYMELMEKSSLKWLTDGRINTKKNIQISLGSNLPLSNEMTFILVFSMLYTRDPHQLFELLCLQLRSIVKAYSQGLQDLITETSDGELQYNPTELLNYILDGYDKLCHSAKSLSPLLFELQRGHLQQFSLTWCLINKRMYQRFVYLEVQRIIPECILKLKELLFDEEYKSMVYRFIQFDDEMNSTSQIWRDVWSLLHDYHKAKEDSARRKRVSSAHSLLVAVKESDFNFHPEVLRQRDRPIVEWLALEDRNLVWHYVVHCLKTKWIACTNPRMAATIENIQCRKCNFALATHYVECNCCTCLIAGGTCLGKSKEQLYCAKCSFFKKLDRDYLDYIGEFFSKPLSDKQALERRHVNGMTNSSPSGSSSSSITEIALPDSSEAEQQQQQPSDCGSSSPAKDEDNSSSTVVATSNALADNTSLYHISWAIFKHLPDRVAYTWTTLEPKRFCIFQSEPCKINACRVAINIIAMLYPLNLSKFLIKSYHPLKEDERRKMAENWNIDVKNFMQRFCDDINKRWRTEVADRIHPLHFLDLLWESDDSESALLSDMASAFAEWFLIDFQFPQRNVIYQYFTKFFLVKGTDIEFDMKCFESVSGSRLFNWSTPASPLRQLIANDMQTKLLGVNWSSILPEEALAAINGDDLPVTAKLEGLSSGGVLVATATSTATGPGSAAMAVIEPVVKLCSDDGAICKDCKECFTDTVTKSEIFEKEIKKPLVEALKLAASNKILETELKTLQKEHSMLKDMVRDLEQIHEQKHSNATQQCGNGNSSSSNANSNSNSNNTNSSNTNSNNSKSANVAKNSNSNNSSSSSSSGTSTTQGENGNSTASKGTASSSSGSIPASASVGTVTNTPPSKTGATASPAKAMLNQATNTPSKIVPKGTGPAGVTSQQPTGKVVTKATNTTPKVGAAAAAGSSAASGPSAATTGKVSSKSTSTHPSPASPSAPASATSATATPSTSASTAAASANIVQSKEEHKKTCHRGTNGGEKGDSSCVCYYCTLFGQSVCLDAPVELQNIIPKECNHNQRTNETRDRLRKKIKQLQSNKDNQQLKSLNLKNIKIPHSAMLKKINTNKSNSTNAVTTNTAITNNNNNNNSGSSSSSSNSSTSSITSNSTNGNQAMTAVNKESSAGITSKMEALKISNNKTPVATAAAGLATATKAPVVTKAPVNKMNIAARASEMAISAREVLPIQPNAAVQPTLRPSANNAASLLKVAPKPVEETLDALVRYIEGDYDDEKQKDNKKTAKKVKQKHKKQELKKITELGELSQKFSEFHLEEQKAQKRLQFQQNLKKKDKNQLLEDIKAYEAKKLQLQTDINSLVTSIRSNNPEFSFKMEEGSPESEKKNSKERSDSGKKSSPLVPSVPLEATQQLPLKLQQNINLLQQQKQRQQQQLLQQHQQQHQHQQHSAMIMPPDNGSLDPTRRMVTIKRTFLPHSEPQVTVTAKGPSPDQDQLLYTFINGQLVSPDSSSGKGQAPTKQQIQNHLDQLTMKMAASDIKQLNDLIAKSRFSTDTDFWIAEKLLKLSLRDQLSQSQQAQAIQEIDELMQKIQYQTTGGTTTLDKKRKDDIVTLIGKMSDRLGQIRNKGKNSMSEAQVKAASDMLQKMTKKLEQDYAAISGDEGKKKKKKKKKDKLADEIDEIDEIVAKLDGLDVSNASSKKSDLRKTPEKALGKVLNRKLSKDSISSSGSTQKPKEGKDQKTKDKSKVDDSKDRDKKISAKDKDAKKKLVRKKSEVYIDPEFDNNAFKLLNLEDTESDEEEVAVAVNQSEVSAPVRTPSPVPVPELPKVEEPPRPPTPPCPMPVPPATTMVNKKANKKKNEKAKDPPITAALTPAKDAKQVRNKENLAPQPTPPVQKASRNAHNTASPQQPNVSKKPASSVAQVSEKSMLDNPNLSKRQRKLLMKQQEQVKPPQSQPQAQPQQKKQHQPAAANRHIDKAMKNADRLSKAALNDRRSKVNISADTTLELINDSNMSSSSSSLPSKTGATAMPPKIPNTFPPGDTSFGASIMDQLSRGIRVEGLQLPPGITLTRVDAAQAEAIKAKRESIKKICEPMQPVKQPEPPVVPPPVMMGSSGMYMMNPMMAPPVMMNAAPGQDAVIMVDTNKLKGSAGDGEKKPNKKNKRKNKNKNKNDSSKDSGQSKSDGKQKNHKGNNNSNVVTLRNPMFQGGSARPSPAAAAEPAGTQHPLGYDQRATIFKNDNGMFTIRNPALHQALAGGVPPSTSGFRPFNTNYLVENGIVPPQVSAGTSNVTTANYLQQQQSAKEMSLLADGPSHVSPPFSATIEPPRKCNTAIGSEMKNAQKQKQQQQQQQQQHHHHHHHPHPHQSSWQQLNGVGAPADGGINLYNPLSSVTGTSQPQRCYSPFESLQYGLSGSQEYGGSTPNPSTSYFPMSSPSSTVSAIGSERSQARAQAAAAMSAGNDHSGRRLFGGTGSGMNCDESPGGTPFYDGLGAGSSSTNHKYDDLSFLQNLQPGQRLNSEVTIHNINESKFLRQQSQNLSNDIEITRIPAAGSSSMPPAGFGHPTQATHPLLMSPVGSTISSEAATGVASNAASSGTADATNLLALNDIETSLFMQKYQQQQMQLEQQLQQQMQQLQLQPISRQQQQLLGEYGENIFAPNQMVNLNELESEERDIESFKRFNYYFDPPKNKPKINLNVKDIVVTNKKSPGADSSATGGNHAGGSNGSGGSSSSSSISNDNNPGGVSIGEDILPIRPQAPIGTPSQKGLHQQQNTPASSVGTGVSTMLYPATSDSPASSASIFDGISSSMSSHAHSCDDLYNDLLSSTGNLSLNLNLNLTQLQQSNSDPIAYDSSAFGVGTAGRAPSLGSVGSSSNGTGAGKPSAAELAQSIISN